MRRRRKTSGARIVFSCGFDSLPFELGVFFVQEEAKKRVRRAGLAGQGPRARHDAARFPAAPPRARKAIFEAVAKDLSLVAMLRDPVRADAGIRRAEAAARQQARLR